MLGRMKMADEKNVGKVFVIRNAAMVLIAGYIVDSWFVSLLLPLCSGISHFCCWSHYEPVSRYARWKTRFWFRKWFIDNCSK
eukprot:m.122074 g.122074  ORF g.122074 m.122074 type:complete len:82 (+) comp37766_c0_seq24:270-515(+)